MLEHLTLHNLGPALKMSFALGERVYLLTGDNGLGKTFLLDLASSSMAAVRTPDEIEPSLAGRLRRSIPSVERLKAKAVPNPQRQEPIMASFFLDA